MDAPGSAAKNLYRGRIAPSPTGFLHVGHARTFWIAQSRCRENDGTMVLRNDDLDAKRVRSEFIKAMYEDLGWFGLSWQEGPDIGGPHGPYNQSERFELYCSAFKELKRKELIYPCTCSRQDVLRALEAPHRGEEEPRYPGMCRERKIEDFPAGTRVNWRFRTRENESVTFNDGNFGTQTFTSGKDFGDFVVWRHDDVASYQLACVVDDAGMGITEVVRGADLLMSTARQLLLYQAFDLVPPSFFHCELMFDEKGNRLAKRHDSLSLRVLREQGRSPEEIREGWLSSGKR
jgi:glutamyl-tRNA synthetase